MKIAGQTPKKFNARRGCDRAKKSSRQCLQLRCRKIAVTLLRWLLNDDFMGLKKAKEEK